VRPGVLEKLDQALDHAVTLVSAPAGYEKIPILNTQLGDEISAPFLYAIVGSVSMLSGEVNGA